MPYLNKIDDDGIFHISVLEKTFVTHIDMDTSLMNFSNAFQRSITAKRNAIFSNDCKTIIKLIMSNVINR